MNKVKVYLEMIELNERTNERINTLKSRIFSFRAIDISISPPPPVSLLLYSQRTMQNTFLLSLRLPDSVISSI